MSRAKLFRKILDPSFLVWLTNDFVSRVHTLHKRKREIIQKGISSENKDELLDILGQEQDLFKRFFRHFEFLTEKRNQLKIINIIGDTPNVNKAFDILDELKTLFKTGLFRKSSLMICLRRQEYNTQTLNQKFLDIYFKKELEIYERFEDALSKAKDLANTLIRERTQASQIIRVILELRRWMTLAKTNVAGFMAAVILAITVFSASPDVSMPPRPIPVKKKSSS